MHNSTVIQVLLIEMSVILLLFRFEDIDFVQRLSRQVEELTVANEKIKAQHEEMTESWSRVQDLAEMWQHRTIPRLDLQNELHNKLEDEIGVLIVHLAAINDVLDNLERRYGPVETWQDGGRFPLEEKQKFSASVAAVCQHAQLPHMIAGIHTISVS